MPFVAVIIVVVVQYSGLVRRLERDLPELLTFFDFPQPLWRKLRTTNAI